MEFFKKHETKKQLNTRPGKICLQDLTDIPVENVCIMQGSITPSNSFSKLVVVIRNKKDFQIIDQNGVMTTTKKLPKDLWTISSYGLQTKKILNLDSRGFESTIVSPDSQLEAMLKMQIPGEEWKARQNFFKKVLETTKAHIRYGEYKSNHHLCKSNKDDRVSYGNLTTFINVFNKAYHKEFSVLSQKLEKICPKSL